MKKIVLMPVKNEGWILNLTLECTSIWADEIIILDQGSNDNTLEICKKFSKVTILKNEDINFNEGERRKLLLKAARNFEGNNLLFHLDADEIISSEITKKGYLLNNIKPGQAIKIPILNLWGRFDYYNRRYPWGGNYIDIAYRDNGTLEFEDGFIHLSRIPQSLKSECVKIDEFKLLHLQYIDLKKSAAKQRFYRVLEFNNSNKNFKTALKLNFKYFFTKEKPKERVANNSMFAEYVDRGIDLKIEQTDKYWQEEFVIKEIINNGSAIYRWLDIWDVDWNSIKNKYMIKDYIDDPRSVFIKIYHRFIQIIISSTFRTMRSIIVGNIITKEIYKRIKCAINSR